MIEWERRVRLKHYLDQGLSQRAIARKLGISRRTIHRWIRRGELDRDLSAPPRYGPRPKQPCKIDPYRDYVRGRLEAFPKLSAVRLFDEIRAAGYAGGLTQLKGYVRQVRPRPLPDPVVRFETPPGRQGQVDFAHFKLPWGRRYALLVTLSFSRLLWVRFVPRQDMRTLFSGLEQAFTAFGGVPQELLFDQMRSVIVRDLRDEGGPLVENAEFLRFCAHWGFRVRSCRPYRAKTKGKVERPIRYLRESFFYARTFANDDDLNDQVVRWLDHTANVRLHSTTGERPFEHFHALEQARLRPLAARPYRSFVLPPPQSQAPARIIGTVPTVPVERRPLASYAQIAGGVR